ncbi:ribose-5-phosphate isomerase RpiA [Buchnera aphidicola]|uniref:ribose-5-phosphate isomerase RpiA n=1 Tax=Buchnera aphidicola TaxID=9 RepID=UPI003463F8AC
MNFNILKKNVSVSVLNYIPPNSIIGVGSGTTISYFIKSINKYKKNIIGAISSSYNTTILLKKYNVTVIDLNTINEPIIYIDSADEVNSDMQMIKGKGGALTNEKIISFKAKTFICIVDESKLVKKLGSFCPVPIEVIPISYSYICEEIRKIGGNPIYREGFVTDHGNIIIDIYGLNLEFPQRIENIINSLPGVVSVGLFSIRTADMVMIGTMNGIKIIK